MGIISVKSNNGEYDIKISRNNLTADLSCHLDKNPSNRIYMITDENVGHLYGDTILEFSKLSNEFYEYIIKPGEASKSPEELANIWEDMATKGIGRQDTVLAFGGGVVGDLAGFAAASYLRGIRLIQLPTTLLSQVDSSVGGKVAVDLGGGKNLAGAFYSPELVVIDTSVLETLVARTFSDGMAEVVKYGFISNPDILDLSKKIKEHMDLCDEYFARSIGEKSNFCEKTHQLFERMITECCTIKADIVENDETEKGMRAVLNFGHTIGHAIEAKGAYTKFTHGEAVSIGMIHSLKMGERFQITESDYTQMLVRLLKLWKLPLACEYAGGELMRYIVNDKKAGTDGINFVFIGRLGEPILRNVTFEQIEDYMKNEF